MSLRFDWRRAPFLKIVNGVVSAFSTRTSLNISTLSQARVVINYLLLDTFSSGTIASPRTSNVGHLKTVNTGNALTVNNGLRINGTMQVGDGIVGADSTGTEIDYGRVVGRMLRIENINRVAVGVNLLFGFSENSTDTNITQGINFNSTTGVNVVNKAINLRLYEIGALDPKSILIIQGNVYTKVYVKNGSETETLIWVYTTTPASSFARLFNANSATAHALTVDNISVFDTDVLEDDFTDAVIKNIVPVSGTIYPSVTLGIYHLSFTLTGSPSANLVAVELRYRVQDSSNYWSLRIVRNAGNTAWDLLLIRVLSGSPTTFKTVTGVGTPTRLIAITNGFNHLSWTDASGISTIRGTTVSSGSLFVTGVNTAAVFHASTTIDRLNVWALYPDVYAPYFNH